MNQGTSKLLINHKKMPLNLQKTFIVFTFAAVFLQYHSYGNIQIQKDVLCL
jgi:hypothetical protein